MTAPTTNPFASDPEMDEMDDHDQPRGDDVVPIYEEEQIMTMDDHGLSLQDSLSMDIQFLEQKEGINSHFRTIRSEFNSLRQSMATLQQRIQSECKESTVRRHKEHQDRLFNLQRLCQRKKVHSHYHSDSMLIPHSLSDLLIISK